MFLIEQPRFHLIRPRSHVSQPRFRLTERLVLAERGLVYLYYSVVPSVVLLRQERGRPDSHVFGHHTVTFRRAIFVANCHPRWRRQPATNLRVRNHWRAERFLCLRPTRLRHGDGRANKMSQVRLRDDEMVENVISTEQEILTNRDLSPEKRNLVGTGNFASLARSAPRCGERK